MSPLCVLAQKEGPDVSPNEPSDHRILSVFFDFAKASHFIRPTHKSTSPLGAHGQPENPRWLRDVSTRALRSQDPLRVWDAANA